jgi:DNA-binding CsgD family transcriptional regulator
MRAAERKRGQGALAGHEADEDELRDLGMVRFLVGDQELAVLAFTVPELRFPKELSEAEREIARHLCEGRSMAAIAKLRRRSPFTILNQMRSLYAKLDIHTRAELVYQLSRS